MERSNHGTYGRLKLGQGVSEEEGQGLEGWKSGGREMEGRLCVRREGGMDVGVKCDCYILCGL